MLAIYVLDGDAPVRAGTLTRSSDGATAFIVDEAYLRDDDRPLLSLRWHSVASEEDTRRRLADRGDKIGLNGILPPWFAGLLPEGGLRELVLAEMGPGAHDQFDLIARLGTDLPGAVLAIPDTDMPTEAGPFRWDRLFGFRAPVAEGVVKFSLAGVQLKFGVQREGDRLTVPGRAGSERYILKVPSETYPLLPEVEFASMHLASLIGVDTARCELVDVAKVEGIPERFLRHGSRALLVERFDRGPGDRRIHMEDAAQILGAVGERKYTMGTSETLLNMVKRFSGDWRSDVIEGFRRIVADILLGNGDNHLKNWSFLFPDGRSPRLSPAYDIVATRLFIPGDPLALRFAGSDRPEAIGTGRFLRVGAFLGLPERLVRSIVADCVARAVDTWPDALAALPITPDQRRRVLEHLNATRLAQELVADRQR
jgi:serine/threonine-protein kinase HipA